MTPRLIPVVVLLVTAPAPAADNDTSGTALVDIQTRISALESNINQARSRLAELEAAVEANREDSARVLATVHKLEDSIDDKRHRLRGIQRDYDAQLVKYGRERRLLAEQLRGQYLTGRTPYLKLMLNQDDPALLGRALAYFDYHHRARSAAIKAAGAEIQSLTVVARALQQEIHELAALQMRYQNTLAELERDYHVRASDAETVQDKLQQRQTQLEQLRADEARLEGLFAKLPLQTETPSAGVSFASRRGQLTWPVTGRLAVRFGARRQIGNLRWRGVFIAADRGEPVHAVAPGRVAFADWFHKWGRLVILDHGNGYMSLYGFNATAEREVGEWVAANDVIATVGDATAQDGPGLYFEVRYRGEPQDPQRWCAGKPVRSASVER
jgi:septal ring factor EnvC (AmiA/AmiB activator)